MTVERPPTRRELRERALAAHAGPAALPEPAETVAVGPEPAAPEPAAPPPEAPIPAAPPTRRALRAVHAELTTAERAGVRRRPVQSPTTTGLTVVDPATGALSAIAVTTLGEVPEPVVPEPVVPEPVVPEPEPVLEPVVQEPEPVLEPVVPQPQPGPQPGVPPSHVRRPGPERGVDGNPPRHSLLGREDPAVESDTGELSVEEAALRPGARGSTLATVLRLLVLLVTAVVIGYLIWHAADAAATTALSLAVPPRGVL